MIVDDEEITRQFIIRCIDWHSLGMNVVAEACGGSEALDLMEQHSPDIVFTDIQMPFMDGLELSKAIVEQYPQTKLVIITAHKDFSYAKTGIELGISHYLLKPVDRKELHTIAESLARQIHEGRQHWTEYSWMKRQLDENREHLREKMLNELLMGTITPEDTQNRFGYYFPETAVRAVQVALVSVFPPDGSSVSNEEDQLTLRLRTLHTAKRMFADIGIKVVLDNSQHIVLISLGKNERLAPACEALRDNVLKVAHCLIFIGVGNAYPKLYQAADSCREALDALRYAYTARVNQVVLYQEELSVDNRQWSVRTEDLAELTFLVKAALTDKAKELMERMLEDGRQHGQNLNQMRVAGVNIATAILNALSELGISSDSLADEAELPYRSIYESDSFEEIHILTAKMLLMAGQSVQGSRASKGVKLVDSVKEYIRQHLSEPSLTLAKIAEELYTNHSYLSRLFKKETGLSFTEHLTKVRMEKAITLLNTSEMKAYQIAEQIGISDAYYFSNCFKKYTGKTVSEYRKNIQEEVGAR